MTQQELAKNVYKTAYIRGDFLLRSGQKSSEYFDKYLFESNPILLKAIAKSLASKVPVGIQVLAGLEVGGIPIATALSLETGIPVCFVRKEAKKYGTAKLAEGADIKNKRVLIIEDVITSGGQVILSANDLRNEGAHIHSVLCVIDREQGGPDKLQKIGIKTIPLFTMSELKKFGI
jgi:orotate phosphoribosyltransferase